MQQTGNPTTLKRMGQLNNISTGWGLGMGKNVADPLALFQTPDTPTPPVIPPAPTQDNASGALDQAALQQARAAQRGRTATLLTGGAGLQDMGSTSKTLLGR